MPAELSGGASNGAESRIDQKPRPYVSGGLPDGSWAHVFTSGDSEAWLTSTEAAMDLFQRVPADRWEADGYEGFFG